MALPSGAAGSQRARKSEGVPRGRYTLGHENQLIGLRPADELFQRCCTCAGDSTTDTDKV
jgi:hypothetical protein